MSEEQNVFGEIAQDRGLGPARGPRLGPGAGLKELGCSVFELDPGGQAAPYQLHHGNEELLIMLDGGEGWAFPAGSDQSYMNLSVAALEADRAKSEFPS